MINVVKKDGSSELFDVKKIKQAIDFSCEGLDVSPLALESKFDQFIVDGITTQSIHENLVEHAKQLCSASQPDWVLVAGRLHTMLHWSNTRSYEQDFLAFFKQQVKDGVWTHEGFEIYSDSDIELLGQHLVKDRDLKHSYASVITAQTKYLLINECIQHMFMGNAMVIASVESVETRLAFAIEVYEALSERKLSLATPWLSGLRNGGNISSCFIIQPNDSLDSIYQSLWDAARISKAGGGLGIDLSLLRANGSSLMGYEGRAGGIAGWTKLYNDTAVTVNQAGKRKGAFTCALAIWHNDISDFLDMQTEAGDQRKKAYDIKPQVVINDHFMVLKDNAKSKWYTFCPHEIADKIGVTLNGVFGEQFVANYELCVQAYKDGVLKVVTVHKAKELFIRIMKNQFETGMPYITFIDTLNAANPNNHVGYIPCFNLCVAPETTVKTDNGEIVISDHVGERVNVWNGEQWSDVEIIKTGVNQQLIAVTVLKYLDGKFVGETILRATPYHKWYNFQAVELRTFNLEVGTELLDWQDENGRVHSAIVGKLGVTDSDDTYCFTEPLRHMGVFNGILTGQCTESTSVVLADETAHTCNLLSPVVGRIAKEDISKYAGLSAHILDNGITLTNPPIDKSREHNESLRTIGIGIQGYHDYVANNWLTFSDVNAATELAERIQYGAILESIRLAKERGAYPLFKGSRWDTGELTSNYARDSVCPDIDWHFVQSQIDLYGIRNSQLTSPAPNTSTSIFMDAAAGVMPVYSGFFYEDNGDGVLPVSSMYLKENPLSYMRGVTTYKPWELTKIIGGMQKFVDTGISAEYIMDKNQEGLTAKWLWDTVQQAWKNKTKAVYYIRTVKKGESLVKGAEDCAACSG